MTRFLFFILFGVLSSLLVSAQEVLGPRPYARYISVDAQHQLWSLGTDYSIYHFDGKVWTEHPSHEKVRFVSVSPKGTLYTINYNDLAHRSDGDKKWVYLNAERVKWIGADANEKIWSSWLPK